MSLTRILKDGFCCWLVSYHVIWDVPSSECWAEVMFCLSTAEEASLSDKVFSLSFSVGQIDESTRSEWQLFLCHSHRLRNVPLFGNPFCWFPYLVTLCFSWETFCWPGQDYVSPDLQLVTLYPDKSTLSFWHHPVTESCPRSTIFRPIPPLQKSAWSWGTDLSCPAERMLQPNGSWSREENDSKKDDQHQTREGLDGED